MVVLKVVLVIEYVGYPSRARHFSTNSTLLCLNFLLLNIYLKNMVTQTLNVQIVNISPDSVG